MKNHSILQQIIYVLPLRTALYKSYPNNLKPYNLIAEMILKNNVVIHDKNASVIQENFYKQAVSKIPEIKKPHTF